MCCCEHFSLHVFLLLKMILIERWYSRLSRRFLFSLQPNSRQQIEQLALHGYDRKLRHMIFADKKRLPLFV